MAAPRCMLSGINLSRVELCTTNAIRLSTRHVRLLSKKAASWKPIHICCFSTEAKERVAPPVGETLNLEYSEKVKNIADSITTLTLLEVASLNQLLKEKLNIQDIPMMPMGAMPLGAPVAVEEEAEEAPPEKTEFTVKLVKYDDKSKVKLIKEVKSLMADMNLVQAKKFVESAPQILKENIPKEEAEKIKKSIEDIGGTVEIE